jgi:hypothetical protein
MLPLALGKNLQTVIKASIALYLASSTYFGALLHPRILVVIGKDR